MFFVFIHAFLSIFLYPLTFYHFSRIKHFYILREPPDESEKYQIIQNRGSYRNLLKFTVIAVAVFCSNDLGFPLSLSICIRVFVVLATYLWLITTRTGCHMLSPPQVYQCFFLKRPKEWKSEINHFYWALLNSLSCLFSCLVSTMNTI